MLSVWVLFLLSWRRVCNDTACNYSRKKKKKKKENAKRQNRGVGISKEFGEGLRKRL